MASRDKDEREREEKRVQFEAKRSAALEELAKIREACARQDPVGLEPGHASIDDLRDAILRAHESRTSWLVIVFRARRSLETKVSLDVISDPVRDARNDYELEQITRTFAGFDPGLAHVEMRGIIRGLRETRALKEEIEKLKQRNDEMRRNLPSFFHPMMGFGRW